MTEPVISDMMNTIVDAVRVALPDMGNRITYGAPETFPGVPCIWFDYNLLELEMGLLDVALHQAIATVAVPRKTQYPAEYRYVTDLMQSVRQAVRQSPVYGDAVLVAIENQPATESAYAGQPGAMVAGRLTFTLETKTEITP